MPVTATDLLEPAGQLDGSLLFPTLTQEAVAALLQGYLDRAAAILADADVTDQASIDSGMYAYAYGRAYEKVYLTIQATARTRSIEGEGSMSWGADQAAAFAQKSSDYMREFQGIVAAVSPEPGGPGTVSQPCEFSW